MTTEELRQKYPKFIFEKYEYRKTDGNLEISYFYSILPDHKFVHKISTPLLFPPNLGGNHKGVFENLIFHIGLSLMPSYWKLTCSPQIEVRAGSLSPEQLIFWHKLFLKGMGEYFFRNNIDFTYKDFLKIRAGEPESLRVEEKNLHSPALTLSRSVLVPVGGGKDSIVTLELLKKDYSVIPFIVNPVPVISDICKTVGLEPFVMHSTLDLHLLELNSRGFLNGHIPVTATHSFEALLAADISGCSFIAFSNERSSNEGNTEYLDHTINHQYSKTLEFETDLNSYLLSRISHIKYFSFLRPLYELQITKIFTGFPQYFSVFSSCNQNFKLMPSAPSLMPKWCNHCPKCVSSALLLAAWLGKPTVTQIMSVFPPDLPENSEILKDLLGINPVKPFECVLTRDEAHIAQDLISHGPSEKSRLFMSSWLDNPNMPKEFEKILKNNLIP